MKITCTHVFKANIYYESMSKCEIFTKFSTWRASKRFMV
eukprot:UN19171